jgi:hypothetical protein
MLKRLRSTYAPKPAEGISAVALQDSATNERSIAGVALHLNRIFRTLGADQSGQKRLNSLETERLTRNRASLLRNIFLSWRLFGVTLLNSIDYSQKSRETCTESAEDPLNRIFRTLGADQLARRDSTPWKEKGLEKPS